MMRYKKFLEKYFVWIQLVIALAICLGFLAYMINVAKRPLSSTQLETHEQHLQMLKEDIGNISKIENSKLEVTNEQITVKINEPDCTLKAIFDTDGNYLTSEIIDTRLGGNAGDCFMLTLMIFVFTFVISFVVKGVLYIPVLVFTLLQKRKKDYS